MSTTLDFRPSIKTSMKTCLISILPPSSTAERFILIRIQIVTAADNHILTAETERFQNLFEWGDGVKWAGPLTALQPITLSVPVPS